MIWYVYVDLSLFSLLIYLKNVWLYWSCHCSCIHRDSWQHVLTLLITVACQSPCVLHMILSLQLHSQGCLAACLGSSWLAIQITQECVLILSLQLQSQVCLTACLCSSCFLMEWHMGIHRSMGHDGPSRPLNTHNTVRQQETQGDVKTQNVAQRTTMDGLR